MILCKSLIVSCALMLALICAGILAASAHTLTAAQQQRSARPSYAGIAAVPATPGQQFVSSRAVKDYIQSRGFVGGPTLNGEAPRLQDFQLTSIIHLDHLGYSLKRQFSDKKMVYSAQLDGPFLVLPQLPLPVLSCLLPSAGNLPAFLPHLGNLSSLGLNNNPLTTLLPAPEYRLPRTLPALPGPHRLPLLPDLRRMPDLSHMQASPFHLQAGEPDIVFERAFEIFDAEDGNLLAWG